MKKTITDALATMARASYRHKKKIAAMALLAAMTGCSTTERDNAFDIACASIPTADAMFQVYAGTGKVSQSIIDGERQAIAVAQTVCNGPRPADVKSSLAAVNRAATAILGYIAQAKKQAAT